MPAKYTDEEFWRWVDSSGGPDACWPWQRGIHANGYGRARITVNGIWTCIASRAAFMFTTGQDPGDLDVLHSCDNPPCCNPAHLSAGTAKQNAAECVVRGRRPSGEDSTRARFTEADVREVRRRAASGELLSHLSAEFGAPNSWAYKVATGKLWRHLPFLDGETYVPAKLRPLDPIIRCSRCGEEQSVDSFPSSDRPGSRRSQCAKCRASDARDRRAKDPSGYNAKRRARALIKRNVSTS